MPRQVIKVSTRVSCSCLPTPPSIQSYLSPLPTPIRNWALYLLKTHAHTRIEQPSPPQIGAVTAQPRPLSLSLLSTCFRSDSFRVPSTGVGHAANRIIFRFSYIGTWSWKRWWQFCSREGCCSRTRESEKREVCHGGCWVRICRRNCADGGGADLWWLVCADFGGWGGVLLKWPRRRVESGYCTTAVVS